MNQTLHDKEFFSCFPIEKWNSESVAFKVPSLTTERYQLLRARSFKGDPAHYLLHGKSLTIKEVDST